MYFVNPNAAQSFIYVFSGDAFITHYWQAYCC